jgi:hypothetical protein
MIVILRALKNNETSRINLKKDEWKRVIHALEVEFQYCFMRTKRVYVLLRYRTGPPILDVMRCEAGASSALCV